MAGLWELHDRHRFEITAISLGPDDKSAMRRRVVAAFDRFVEAGGRSDREIAGLLRNHEVDIAIDLGGITTNCRPGILAHRPAPVQVSYLGYPGTTAAAHLDYVIADRTVLPPEDHAFFTEKVAYLPETYQANDAKRPIAPRVPSRRDLGLPETGLVFCCFNVSYKIAPAVFEVWMRILRKAAGSVLWLFGDNAAAVRNLRREAAARDIAPERLVFAPRVGAAEHLARHARADLFLDTLPYNGHTTASDALWAGVPVITCLGTAFPGRVAASLLRALGLPELITVSLAEYEELVLRLAADPDLLAGVTAKLARHRVTAPLFDTERFCRHIEDAYIRMWQRSRQGLPPESFAVEASPR